MYTRTVMYTHVYITLYVCARARMCVMYVLHISLFRGILMQMITVKGNL